jgi:LCP family protein required for cell wall assembly
MSIPRDSYVPISCRDNTKNKLTHAGWFGTDCMIKSIENVFDIDINYYVKVNFKGVVGIVEALGGVEVDVPQRLCTDDSNRQGQICIDAGYQTLNGEQALVLARNRYDLKLGDIGRGYNQQLLLKALISKLTQVRSVNTVLDLLETISNNIDTNFSTDEILSFYNIFKDILISRQYQSNDDFLNMIQIRLAGVNKKVYFPNLKSYLWAYLLNDESVEEATKEMRINLGLEEADLIKDFEFTP